MSERAQLRANQLIQTFGPGAMVDMPEKSVIIAGLHGWSYRPEQQCIIHEPRLAAKVGKLFNKPSIELRSPPPAEELQFRQGRVQPAVKGYIFPHWFIVQYAQDAAHGHRRRRLVQVKELERGRFREPLDGNKAKPVVPVRFVRACRKGHVGDIQWRDFVHGGRVPCQRDLWIEERGTSGDLSEIWIVCDCGAQRSLRDAAKRDQSPPPLGLCNGSRPWLNDIECSCGEPNWLLQRNASNAYFPRLLPVISIPGSMDGVDVVVLELWEDFFQFSETAADVARDRKRPKLTAKLRDFTDAALLASIQRVRGGEAALAVSRTVKEVEFDALTHAPSEAATDEPDGDFFARELEPARWQAPWLAALEKVVLVHRLREVTALTGFTRFDSAGPDIAGELPDLEIAPAALIDNPKWMPAVENRGEGFFLKFRAEDVDEWRAKPAVQEREAALKEGFHAWLKTREVPAGEYPGAPYVLLHSLAHMLITAISLECGYPSSSLRERIYAPVPGSAGMTGCYGILIYTSSSDAQGTLGGLVHAARELRRHLTRACQLGNLCSNDPVCSSHTPGHGAVEQLSGSACHGCLYIAETSCEQSNRYLDRSLVVATIEHLGCEFFQLPA